MNQVQGTSENWQTLCPLWNEVDMCLRQRMGQGRTGGWSETLLSFSFTLAYSSTHTHTHTFHCFLQVLWPLTLCPPFHSRPFPFVSFPQLSVKGYNDKQHILLKKIIEKMAAFEIDEKRFDIIKEAVS